MNRTTADTNFDDLADRFGERIYGSVKGRLRLALVWRDLLAVLPEVTGGTPLACADTGGGQGQFARKLLEQGHALLLNDLSANMLDAARAQSGEHAQLTYHHGSLQSLAAVPEQQGAYDLVVCHAVLEWLAQPLASLSHLFALLKPGGALSLMFYNRNGLILNDMSKGNYKKLMAEDFAGDAGGLTPPNPLLPEEVISEVLNLGGAVISKRGIRCAWDVLRRELRDQRSFEDILEIEWTYGDREPFWQLGRYVHLVVRV